MTSQDSVFAGVLKKQSHTTVSGLTLLQGGSSEQREKEDRSINAKNIIFSPVLCHIICKTNVLFHAKWIHAIQNSHL